MFKKFTRLVFCAAILVASGSLQAGTIAYNVEEGAVGDQNFGGSLGLDFIVNDTIFVTHLGAFDSGSDGFMLDIVAEIWERDDGGTPDVQGDDAGVEVLVSMPFTGDDPGELIQGYRFKELSPPIELAPGSYTMNGFGYGVGEPNGNTGQGSPRVSDDGNGLITFVEAARFGDPNTGGSFPNSPDGTGPDGSNFRYLAGSFIFEQDITRFVIDGGGETYLQDFDAMETGKSLPRGWKGTTSEGTSGRADGLGLTDGFLTVPGSPDDGVLGILNLGGNPESFGPAPDGDIPTWTAELSGNDIFGRDDVIADNASDRALGIGREDNADVGELNFEIEIAENTMRAFVLDWDLEIWGGDPDALFRSSDGPGMKVEVTVGGNSYDTMTANLFPGVSFDSIEDGESDHNATLIDGNVHSVRDISSGIKEVSAADGAVGNLVQINFNTNWNDNLNGPDGWFTAVDNVRLRALAPGDADANGVVDVADLLQLLGGQKFNQGVDGVTWEQGDFNADDQFDTGDLLAMLSFLSGTFPSNPYASEAGGSSDAVADVIVNSETGEVTVDLAGHTVSAIIIESASEIFKGTQPQWDTTSQFPSTLPGELGNVLFTSTASGVDELGAVISAEFLGRDKEFYLQDLDLNILIASEGGVLTKGNVIVVPEPSTWVLWGLGSLALIGVMRRRRV